MKPKPKKRDEIENIISTAVEQARAFIEADIAPDRIKAERYERGEVDLKHEEGRSMAVATKCRDVVRALMPNVLRVFLSNDKPVEFLPRGPEDVEAAQQATDFINWKFSEKNGYDLLRTVFWDSAVKKVGIAKVYFEDYATQTVESLSGLTEEEVLALSLDQDSELIETEQGEDGTFDVKLARTRNEGDICIEAIPPEEFFVNADARDLTTAMVCGNSTEMTVGDLVKMGVDFETAHNLDREETDEEDHVRRDWTEDESESIDPASRRVLVTEAYKEVDIDGTGVPRLYRFLLGGTGYKLLDYDEAPERPYAIFEADPIPHTFFGRSIVELVLEDQNVATSLLRGMLDNIAASNNPAMAFNKQTVSQADMLNRGHGARIRVDGPTVGQIEPVIVPSMANNVLSGIQYFDEVIENKTGVKQMNVGASSDILQASTRAGAEAAVAQSAAQVEVVVRNLADGVKQLFGLMLKVMHRHMPRRQIMKLNGQYIPVDLRQISPMMDMSVNVGLGSSGDLERLTALQETLQMQLQIWMQGGGPNNGLVSLTQIRNTLADILAVRGIKNDGRYWQPMNPQIEAMALQQAQAAQQGQGDPNAAFLQAEQMKTSARVQADMAETQRKAMADAAADDRERDKMEQDAILKAAELQAKHSAQVSAEQIRQLQAQPR